VLSVDERQRVFEATEVGEVWGVGRRISKQFNSVEALLANPGIERFVAWVKTKPIDMMERTRKSQRLRTRS
jgi:phage anti-repressor protein